jgi:PhnB protein
VSVAGATIGSNDILEGTMTVRLNPYLSFNGNAREAMEFYQSVFGGDLDVSTFADAGGMGVPDDEQSKVMHAMLDVPGVLTLMGSDSPSHMGYQAPAGTSISLSGDDDATLRGWWDGLTADGKVTVPLEVAPWGDAFGMATDKYGIDWMVNIAGPGNQG